MGRSPCCEKAGLKKGPWTPEEDKKLLAYIEQHGHGSWRALPAKAGAFKRRKLLLTGLQRCGKSCRLRWTNYLRPDIKRGKFSLQEEQTIIQLHALLGNRWSAIAAHLPKRTDNEIKNYWNTHLKKRLTRMGIDPVTHKPKLDAFGSTGTSKDAANLSHMAQWESARLEAEARLVRESKSMVVSNKNPHLMITMKKTLPRIGLPCLDVLKVWQSNLLTNMPLLSKDGHNINTYGIFMAGDDLESPTSTLNFSENMISVPTNNNAGLLSGIAILQAENEILAAYEQALKAGSDQNDIIGNITATTTLQLDRLTSMIEGSTSSVSVVADHGVDMNNMVFGDQNSSDQIHHHDHGSSFDVSFAENKNYWNNVLDLVNGYPSGSPVF